jgi:hypothetical protein
MPIRRAREWTARGALVGLIAGTIYVGAFAVIFGLRSALDGWNTLWVGMVLLAVIAVPVGSALGTIVGLIVRTSEMGGGEIANPPSRTPHRAVRDRRGLYGGDGSLLRRYPHSSTRIRRRARCHRSHRLAADPDPPTQRPALRHSQPRTPRADVLRQTGRAGPSHTANDSTHAPRQPAWRYASAVCRALP